MLLKTDGAKEYILTCIGIVGEIEEEWIRSVLSANYSPRFIKNLINEMLSGKLIKRTKENHFRLKKPKGLEWVKSKSEDLYSNYMLITNNHSFAGGERRTRRRFANIKILEHLIEKNIPINFYDLKLQTTIGRKSAYKTENNIMDIIGISRDVSKEYRSIFEPATRELKTLDELFAFIEPDDVFFLTGKIIRQEEHSTIHQTTTRKSSSRMYGILVSNQNFYPVYYVNAGTEWSPKIENQANLILKNSWWKKWGNEEKEKDYSANLKGDAIFYYDAPGTAEEYTNKILQKRPKGIRPWDVYEKAFLIPLSDNYIEKIILANDFENKLHNALFGEARKYDSFYDATINNSPTWEVLTNDIVKIRKIKSIEKTIKDAGYSPILIAQEWQEKYLKKIFEDARIVVLNNKEIEKIVQSIRER